MGKQNQSRQNSNQKGKTSIPVQATSNSESPTTKIVLALIAALATIVVAIIGYSANIKGTLLPIEFTQTAESLHTSVALTNAANAIDTSVALTSQGRLLVFTPTITETLIPSLTSSSTPSFTPKPTRTQIPTATKTPTITPLPLFSYGGLIFNCIPTIYWQMDAKSQSGNCLAVNNSGLSSNERSFIIFVKNNQVLEKTVSMDISKFEDVDISFKAEVKEISGDIQVSFPKLGVGLCNPQKPLFEHAFIYYSVYDNRQIRAITFNDINNNREDYYFYNGEPNEFFVELRGSIISIRRDNVYVVKSKTIYRPDNMSFCLYYSLPANGALDARIQNLFIEGK